MEILVSSAALTSVTHPASVKAAEETRREAQLICYGRPPGRSQSLGKQVPVNTLSKKGQDQKKYLMGNVELPAEEERRVKPTELSSVSGIHGKPTVPVNRPAPSASVVANSKLL